ncbi:DUF29 domain-containing protein [Altericista sp. CCNU0014]|uniref:DUF29 domain-containing protein n=1 Tax=Altericista sp. CCNU0014 TaxID=3082949 RepID=UPI00385036E3
MTYTTTLLYDTDFAQWAEQTAQMLKDGRFSEVDLENLIEEVEDLSRRERDALYSNLKIILLHLLKWEFQPHKQTNSWRASIVEHRQRIKRQIKKSPSLKSYPEEILSECYTEARELASVETRLPFDTFPAECPYAIADILDAAFLPDSCVE